MVEVIVIDHIGRRGEGVAASGAGPIYVPYTLPGELVEVDAWPGHPDRRNLLRVETGSTDRVQPECPHFAVCGGCALQHWQPPQYRAWKRQLVVNELHRAGIAVPVIDLVDAHGEGRRRVVLHARRGPRDILEVGFAALHAHQIVAIDHCPILAPGLRGTIEAAWAIAEALATLGKPLDVQATATDAGIDIDIRGSGPLTAPLGLALARLAEAHRLARITRHGELVAQRVHPMIRIGRAIVKLPPGCFLQATVLGEEMLAQRVLAYLEAAGGRAPRTVADLFAGVGPFALRLAERTRVFASDADEAALQALHRAAAATNGLKPVEVAVRDLFRHPLAAAELAGFDAVVFDPPRQGAEQQARALAQSRVGIIVAVSCNPVTFARDARILCEGGYRLSEVTPVDQFRYSAHVEIVACFVR